MYINLPYLEGVLGLAIGCVGFFLGWGLDDDVLFVVLTAIAIAMVVDARRRQ